jgi:germination protein YpeB
VEEKSKKINFLMYLLLSLALAVAIVFAAYQTTKANEYKNEISMDYQRVFTEMTQYVDDLQLSLEKSMFVNDPNQMIRLSGEIYRNASDAKANLALLPLETEPLEKLSEFLSQAGDYSYTLSMKMLEGEEVTEEEYETLKKLSAYAQSVAKSLDNDLEKVFVGTLSIEEASRDKSLSQIESAMSEIEDSMHDYPTLIYDGPFSSHLTDKKSVLVSQTAEISEDEAIAKAKSISGDLSFSISEEEGVLPMYYLSDDSVTIGITKNGGYLEFLLNDRFVGDEEIDMAQARLKATEFLTNNGYPDMKESYYEKSHSVAVINYAAEQEGYTLYPDLIKVKVALDTGEVIGVEARGYIMNHFTRNLPNIKISAEEAKKKVNPNVEIEGVSRALIPTDGGGEKFCWQIEGRIEDRRCLIYIDMETGAEEKLYLLIESESGTLTA